VFARHFVGAVHDKEVIAAMRYFRRRLGRPLVIIWDRLQAHRSKAVSAWHEGNSVPYSIVPMSSASSSSMPGSMLSGLAEVV